MKCLSAPHAAVNTVTLHLTSFFTNVLTVIHDNKATKQGWDFF